MILCVLFEQGVEGGTAAGVCFGVGTGNQEFHMEECMISASGDWVQGGCLELGEQL